MKVKEREDTMDFHTEYDIKEDNLLAGPEITTLTKNIPIIAGTAMKPTSI